MGNSVINSDIFLESNINGVKNLLDLVRHKPVNCNERPIFFQISTDEVYGDINEGQHTESDLLKPSNPYSASKAAADMLIFAWNFSSSIISRIRKDFKNSQKKIIVPFPKVKDTSNSVIR